jgi:hypothetical protein
MAGASVAVTNLILPHRYKAANSLAEYLHFAGGERKFSNTQLLTEAFLSTLQAVSTKRGMSNNEIIDAILNTAASVVIAAAPKTEWRNAADTLADALKERLTIVDDR